MKPLLLCFALLAAGLAWLAADDGARHQTIRSVRNVTTGMVDQLLAQSSVRGIKEGLAAGDEEALTTLGLFHTSRRGLPRALNRALLREFGKPDSVLGLKYLRRAMDGGSTTAEWMYWRRVGWPSDDSLLSLVQAGSEVAGWRLITNLASSGCDVDDNRLRALHNAAPALAGSSWLGGLESRSVDDATRLQDNVEAIQKWLRESCRTETP
ncbi:MAG: hypothetical protein ACI80V_000040 [Rhodothermales bacterium]|jgi:hypothetical protein